MDAFNSVAGFIATLFIGIFGGGAFWQWWKDRKKDKAAGQVAHATVEIQVDAARMQNLESRLALSERAWDSERTSFERRIAMLEKDLHDERLESEHKDAKILKLEEKLLAVQAELNDMSDTLLELKQGRHSH